VRDLRLAEGKSLPEFAAFPMIAASEQLLPGDFDKLLGTWQLGSDVGLFKENREIYHWLFAADGALMHRSVRHLNNVGLFSPRDYRIEKRANEYRIAVLGDEQTSSTLDSLSWPNLLEDVLGADQDLARFFPSTRFTVWNFGWPDSGFPIWEDSLRNKVMPLSPDLVLVNFVPHSFQRLIAGKPATLGGRSDIVAYPVGYRLSDAPGDEAFLLVFSAGPADVAGPPSLRNPRCTVGGVWQIFAPPNVLDNPEKLTELRRRISADYYSVDAAERVAFLALAAHETDVGDLTARAAGHLRAMQQVAPRLIIARGPWYTEVAQTAPGGEQALLADDEGLDPFTPRLRAMAPDLKIELMAPRVAAKYRPRVAREFFQPYDRSKWSPIGHRAYAQEVAELIKERLLPSGIQVQRVVIDFGQVRYEDGWVTRGLDRWHDVWEATVGRKDDFVSAVIARWSPRVKPLLQRWGVFGPLKAILDRSLAWLRRR
jgi:hypothetical protein